MVLGRQDCLWGGHREGLGPGLGEEAGLETAVCVLPTWDNCEHPTVAQHPRAAKGEVREIPVVSWVGVGEGHLHLLVSWESLGGNGSVWPCGHFSSHFPGHGAE